MKKLLIIRFSSIGDIVLTTPVVRCLKKQLPDVEIHFLTKKQFVPVLEANPYIDKIYSIQEEISEVIDDLKNENYDHIVDLHKNFRSKGVILRLRKPSTSFNKINIQKWLIVNLKINHLPKVHIVDRYFQAVEKLGIRNEQLGLDYFIPEVDEVDLKSLPESHQQGYVGWVIGGKHSTKIYPEEKVIEACKKTSQPILLLGGREDEPKGERIRKAVGNAVFNACGKYNINQSASLVRQASKIITNDTGLMHIAAAFKKEIISLWGNTIPEFGMYPYMPGQENNSHILEVKKLSCRPCSKIGYEKCPKGHFKCMNDINLSDLTKLR
ncbi:MAG: glycosyltransferase family 9 protein [Bacteroidales bacterium]|nr:glycosyltransferase family 9 protein [Bacteroidales bacterium]MCF8403762.1 glycosyltransferase family 9 protein [Bacteroidales bacterium]